MVLPAELLQVGYAAEMREYLARNYSTLTIVTFRRLVFKGILQETVLLMGVREHGATAQIVFREVHDLAGLTAMNGHHDVLTVDLDHAREKWTQYFLSKEELDLIRELERTGSFTTLGSLASVDVGIVTGRNEFFALTPSEARRFGIASSCVPLVGRSAQIPGLRLSAAAWEQLKSGDSKCLLLMLPDVDLDQLDFDSAAYVVGGQKLGFHEGYKCRIRMPRWWVVPSSWAPDAFLLRQIYDAPRVVLNEAGATCTDTIHRVRVKPGVDARRLAAASVNSMTCAFAEIRGRSYGGGVLELEPTEAESLPFPRLGEMDLEALDDFARERGVAALMAEVDRMTLKAGGLTLKEISTLREIWRKLSFRRLERASSRPVGSPARLPGPGATGTNNVGVVAASVART